IVTSSESIFFGNSHFGTTSSTIFFNLAFGRVKWFLGYNSQSIIIKSSVFFAMKVNGTFRYTATEDFSAVELPYGDSTFSMVVMVPLQDIKVEDLVARMDVSTWNE
ncbi:MAG: hypothetical protein R6T92_11150, partial [Desulfosalsimonadaceae bacterium]